MDKMYTDYLAIVKKLMALGSKIDSGEYTAEDKAEFANLRSRWGKQKYVPKDTNKDKEGYLYNDPGTYMSKFNDEGKDIGGQGSPSTENIFTFPYDQMQDLLDKNNSVKKYAPSNNNKGGLAKKTKGFKHGGLAGQGHNDMRKGGLFK